MTEVLGVVSPLDYALAALALSGLVVGALVALRRGAARAERLVPLVLGLALGLDVVAYLAHDVTSGEFTWRTSLPLALCNAAVVVAVVALVSRARLAVELTWYVGLAGTFQAVLTPDEQQPFPRLQFFEYLVGHLGVVGAALVLVVGLGLYPRPGSWWRCYLLVVGYTALVAVVDWVGRADYMFLRTPPRSASLLGLLGPWPGYLFAAAGIGLVLVFVLGLPFDPPARARVYSAWSWGCVVAVGLVTWPAVVLGARRRRWGRFLAAGRLLARLTGLVPHVDGEVPGGGPFVVLANHESFLDGMVVVLAHRRPAVLVVGGVLAHQRIAGPFLRALDASFVGPASGRDYAEVLDELRTKLRGGTDVIGFPEGGLHHRESGPRLRLGLFRLAAECGVPILPVALVGSESVVAPGRRAVAHGRIDAHIGTPLRAASSSPTELRHLADEFAAALGALGAVRFAGTDGVARAPQ